MGGTRYYTEAAGEPPGRWAGRGAVTLGLAGDVDADVLQALYMDRVGPDGVRLDARARAKFRPVKEREDLASEGSWRRSGRPSGPNRGTPHRISTSL